ncbi:MAG: DUF418 domain-containing protein [Chitinophagaceae bacterium]
MTINATPIEQKERAIIVDALRGFALTGVLIANFTSFTDQQVPADILHPISSPLDLTLSHINTVFFEWKFMTLFSILFGYGFGLLLSSIEKKNINPNRFFIKRMLWLFIIGFIHTSFWWFDVLHFYAICGLLLLLFKKASNRKILIFSILLMLVFPFCFSLAIKDQPPTFHDADWKNAYEQFKYGNLIDVFKTNLIGYYKLFILSASDVHDIVETLGRFLFGYYLVRIKLFEAIESKKKLFTKVVFISSPFAIAYIIVKWLAVTGIINISSVYWEPFIKIGIISITTFYSGIIILAFISVGQNIVFKILQALGKMTLTNYLLISAVNIILLYGIGFGKLGELSMHTIWLLAFGWLIVEIVFSSLWLRVFRYGPVEWIWRQLTYWRKLPLRK